MPKRKREDNKESKGAASDTSVSTVKPTGDGVQRFTIPLSDKSIQCERRGGDSKLCLIFTHGAGGGLSNAATKNFTDGFAEVSSVVSFQGNMNLQGRVNSFNAVIKHENTRVALGGRSMGARAAVIAASHPDANVEAVILASFPMVGAQKGDSREQILLDLPEGIDVLFISGSNDSMCSMERLQRVVKKMKARSWIVEVQGADHGMSIKSKAGVEPVRKSQGTLAAKWLIERDASKRYYSLSWSNNKVESTGWQEVSEPSNSQSASRGKKAKASE
jgi:dienelactone hydrolase